MNQDKLYLINKLFNNKTIRTIWDKENEKYYVSAVDVAGELSNSAEPRKYWNWLKNKVKKEEDFELSSITRQLKLKSSDGKYYKTDLVTIEGMFRIIESIPSKNAEVFCIKWYNYLFDKIVTHYDIGLPISEFNNFIILGGKILWN